MLNCGCLSLWIIQQCVEKCVVYDDGNVVQQENERIKQSRDTEEKLMVTAWYNLVRCNRLNINQLAYLYNKKNCELFGH